MLTKQHQFATRLTQPRQRQAYRTHMCGLCHALGDQYGLPYRLLTSYEMVLLNLLTSAQCCEPVEVVTRRRPLNPMIKVSTNQDRASKFAAAIAVGLAKVSTEDDVQDSNGRNLLTHLANWTLNRPHQAALGKLSELGFDNEILTGLAEQQGIAEQNEIEDAAKPSAMASAGLFAMTARLAGTLQNEPTLTVIGAHYGTYIYLMDAFRDYPSDIVRGDYNPLRRFSEYAGNIFTLSHVGIVWLLARFVDTQTAIRQQVQRLQLYRYQDVLVPLLCKPIDHVVEVCSNLVERGQDLTFQQWQVADILKAGVFTLTPATITADTGWPDLLYFGKRDVEGQIIYKGGYRIKDRSNCDPCSNEVIIEPKQEPCNDDPCKSKPRYIGHRKNRWDPWSDEYVITGEAEFCD